MVVGSRTPSMRRVRVREYMQEVGCVGGQGVEFCFQAPQGGRAAKRGEESGECPGTCKGEWERQGPERRGGAVECVQDSLGGRRQCAGGVGGE